ncbi:hypothetical protein [Micromonospora sp. WMMD812]
MAISRLPSVVTMTINWIGGRVESYLLVAHTSRYHTHHSARPNTKVS